MTKVHVVFWHLVGGTIFIEKEDDGSIVSGNKLTKALQFWFGQQALKE